MRRPSPFLAVLLTPVFAAGLFAQIEDLRSEDPKIRKKAAQKIGQKTGGDDKLLCESLADLVRDPVLDVRSEVVIAMIKLRSPHCLDPLMQATRDASPEVQSLAVDGLVDFYLPDYVEFGWLNSIKAFGSSLKDRFRDPEPVMIPRYVEVRPEVVRAIAPLITGGSSMESRANAARAAGVLRGEEAIPELKEGLQSNDSTVIVEAINALEKIADVSVGPDIVPLLTHLDKDVRVAAAIAVGQLRTEEAVEDLVRLVNAGDKHVQRAALTALAKLPDNGQDRLFLLYLSDKDEDLRAAAAEGVGRGGNQGDLKTIQDAFAQEKSTTAKLSMAFAAVHLGDANMISYLVDGLDTTFHSSEAKAFLIELARQERVRNELYTPLTTGSTDQKIALAEVLARSGDRASLPHLDRLTQDADPKVAEAAVIALKNLQARLPPA